MPPLSVSGDVASRGGEVVWIVIYFLLDVVEQTVDRPDGQLEYLFQYLARVLFNHKGNTTGTFQLLYCVEILLHGYFICRFSKGQSM